jgi:hypothetical protein
MGTKPAENIDRAITLYFLRQFIFEINRVGMDQVMDVYRKMPEKDKKNFYSVIGNGKS